MKLTEHEMLVTLATMALKMDDLTPHDIIEALQELGYANVVAEARKKHDDLKRRGFRRTK